MLERPPDSHSEAEESGVDTFAVFLQAVVTDRRSSLTHPLRNWPEILSSRGIVLLFEQQELVHCDCATIPLKS